MCSGSKPCYHLETSSHHRCHLHADKENACVSPAAMLLVTRSEIRCELKAAPMQYGRKGVVPIGQVRRSLPVEPLMLVPCRLIGAHVSMPFHPRGTRASYGEARPLVARGVGLPASACWCPDTSRAPSNGLRDCEIFSVMRRSRVSLLFTNHFTMFASAEKHGEWP